MVVGKNKKFDWPSPARSSSNLNVKWSSVIKRSTSRVESSVDSQPTNVHATPEKPPDRADRVAQYEQRGTRRFGAAFIVILESPVCVPGGPNRWSAHWYRMKRRQQPACRMPAQAGNSVHHRPPLVAPLQLTSIRLVTQPSKSSASVTTADMSPPSAINFRKNTIGDCPGEGLSPLARRSPKLPRYDPRCCRLRSRGRKPRTS